MSDVLYKVLLHIPARGGYWLIAKGLLHREASRVATLAEDTLGFKAVVEEERD